MCVYSFVAQDFLDKWSTPVSPTPSQPWFLEPPSPPVLIPTLTPEELDKFRKIDWDHLLKLLEKAKKYDEENDQKDCEMEDKKERLRQLAKEWGIEGVWFP